MSKILSDEIIKMLTECQNNPDTHEAHLQADATLITLVRLLGFNEVADEYAIVRGRVISEELKEKEKQCKICKKPMTSTDKSSLHYNCGGDCRLCMAESGDPDCIESVIALLQEKLAHFEAML